jgi:hypothetical protein
MKKFFNFLLFVWVLAVSIVNIITLIVGKVDFWVGVFFAVVNVITVYYFLEDSSKKPKPTYDYKAEVDKMRKELGNKFDETII